MGGGLLKSQDVGSVWSVDAGSYRYNYTITNVEPNECKIHNFTNPTEPTDLIIPSEINGYTVTSIGNNAFYTCNNFTGDVVIPSTVTEIGEYAFYGCTGISTMVLNEGLTEIPRYCFGACQFTNVMTIPSTVTKIGRSAFVYNYISGLAFTEGSQLDTIMGSAFLSCKELKGSVVLPEGLKYIGVGAFGGLYDDSHNSSYTLTLPHSLTVIGTEAFGESGVSGTLIIPNTVTIIEENAFYECKKLTNLIFEKGSQLDSIKNRAFYYGGFTNKLVIPNTVKYIGEAAFRYCSLSGLEFEDTDTSPSLLKYIGYRAFEDCDKTSGDLILPNSLDTISDRAFDYTSFNGKLVIPNGIKFIGEEAFGGTSFTDVFCYSITQPTLGFRVFYHNEDYLKIHVPSLESWLTYNDRWYELMYLMEKMPTYTESGWVLGDAPSNSTIKPYTPQDTDHVAINAPYVVGGSNSFTANSIGFCGDETTTNGSLLIKDGGQVIANNIFGDITIEKEVTGYGDDNKWYTLSTPLDDNLDLNSANIDNVSNLLTGSYDLYRYDEPSYKWQNYKNNALNGFTEMKKGEGYLYANAENKTIKFTGDVNNDSITYYELTTSGEMFTGFNLIGNPYTHNIYMGEAIPTPEQQVIIFKLWDWYMDTWNASFLKVTFSDGTPTQWLSPSDGLDWEEFTFTVKAGVTINVTFDEGSPYKDECAFTIRYGDGEIISDEYKEVGSMASVAHGQQLCEFTVKGNSIKYLVNGYYKLTGEGAWAANPAALSTPIKIGEGILVKAIKNATLPIYKTNEAPASKRDEIAEGLLEISVSNKKYNDVAYVSFEKGSGLDKIEHQNENIPLIYIPIENIDYAIATADKDFQEIPLNFETKAMGEYVISLRQYNCNFDELYLIDKQTETQVNILEEDYTFIASSYDNPERFILTRSANEQQAAINNYFAYINNGELIIEGEATINIYDIMGRRVFSNTCKDVVYNISTNCFDTGTYIIQRIDAEGIKTQKIVL